MNSADVVSCLSPSSQQGFGKNWTNGACFTASTSSSVDWGRQRFWFLDQQDSDVQWRTNQWKWECSRLHMHGKLYPSSYRKSYLSSSRTRSTGGRGNTRQQGVGRGKRCHLCMDFRSKRGLFIKSETGTRGGRETRQWEMFREVGTGGLGHHASEGMWRRLILKYNTQLFAALCATSLWPLPGANNRSQ